MPPNGLPWRCAGRINSLPTGGTGCPRRIRSELASLPGLVAGRLALVAGESSLHARHGRAGAVRPCARAPVGPRNFRFRGVGAGGLRALPVSLPRRGRQRRAAVAGPVPMETGRHRGHRLRHCWGGTGGPAGWVADVKSVTVLFPIFALPAVLGEVTYLSLQAVDVPVGSAELFRAAGAIVVAWATFFTGLSWRTYTMTRANNQTLHGVKGAPGGMVADLAALRDDVRGIPADIEHRFDGAVARMQETSAKLEGRIERLEDRHLGEEHR